MPRALITGVLGQDGSYMADLLLAKGYEVHGLVRPHRTPHHENLVLVKDRVALHDGDLTDAAAVDSAFRLSRPHEVYHFGGVAYIPDSFDSPGATVQANVNGTLNVLESMRHRVPGARLYFAASSEMFGDTPEPQNEQSVMRPLSPYAVSKLAAYHMVRTYRKAHGLFACSGIASNHESPRRAMRYVTRKVAMAAARKQPVRLGNLDARRDWGWAPEFVEAMWGMLQLDKPMDLVLATGKSHSVRDLARIAYECMGLDWTKMVSVDASLIRPTDLTLTGDATRAKQVLGWEAKVPFEETIRRMVDAESP
jgi:GDPmannose 4,6-dehydratase